MSFRSFALIAAVSALALGACSNRYSNVYSFKKNSFVAPVQEKSEIAAPVTPNILTGEGAEIPGGAIPGIPGEVPGAAPAPTGIPGLDPVPGAAPDAGAAPGTVPGL